MNDRFKFRVWLKYAKLYYGLDSFYYDRLKNKYTLHFEDGHTKTIKEKDCVIEQCTGLKDKNGKLIYEGDIVKFENEISAVKWCINGFAIDDGVQYLVDDMDIEVIGNIHEKESK